jgi:hypothetical protein
MHWRVPCRSFNCTGQQPPAVVLTGREGERFGGRGLTCHARWELAGGVVTAEQLLPWLDVTDTGDADSMVVDESYVVPVLQRCVNAMLSSGAIRPLSRPCTKRMSGSRSLSAVHALTLRFS